MFVSFPTFDLGISIMREINPALDAENYFLYMNNPEVKSYVNDANCPNSFEDSKRELEFWAGLFHSKRGFYWAITLKSSNDMIGTAGFNVLSFTQKKGELSYDLARQHWGKGIMTKTIREIMRFSKEALELVRLQATTVTTNNNSIKLLTKCGFVKEGRLSKYEYLHGTHVDSYMFAKIL